MHHNAFINLFFCTHSLLVLLTGSCVFLLAVSRLGHAGLEHEELTAFCRERLAAYQVSGPTLATYIHYRLLCCAKSLQCFTC